MAKTKAEKIVQTEIMNYVKSHGWYCIKIIKANESGVHDLLMCIQGLFITCEVKAERFEADPHAQMSSWQKRQYQRVRDAQGMATCCASLKQFKILTKHLIEN